MICALTYRFMVATGFRDPQVFGDVEVHDAAALVSQDDEDEEHLEYDGWDGEEVTGHDVFDMVVEEGPPVGRRRPVA